MENRSSQLRKHGLLAAVFAMLMLALCALACPPTAHADEPAVIAHSIDQATQTRTDYTSVNDAISAGYNGATIIMDADWDFGEGRLDLSGKKSIAIDMNGHKMTSRHWESTVNLSNGVSLKLFSNGSSSEIAYRGYAAVDSSWEWRDLAVTAGGLVTSNNGSSGVGSGIRVESGANLDLEKVVVAGCGVHGIGLSGGSSATLTNATVCHNWRTSTGGDGGAGIYAGSDTTVTMNASRVAENFSALKGGGVYADSGAKIYMENSSSVSNNVAEAGGGFYFNESFFTLESKDGSGTISNNKANRCDTLASKEDQSGGGIHVDSTSGENEGLIEGLTIRDNYAAYDGGGIELDQRWTTVRNCTITGNHAGYDGGGVFVYGGNNTIDNCTITGNWCNEGGGNHEGGGVFVSYHYDIKMAGTCIVKGNTRGKDSGNADDVFLSTLSGGGGKAYITGSLSKESSVGVRTGITGDRRIAKSFSCDTKDCFFIDLGGYYVSYGGEEGGDAWQRHRELQFAAKVNNAVISRYKQDAPVALVAPLTKGTPYYREYGFFWYWDVDNSTGLKPMSEYINDKTKYNSVLNFNMPQNDVNAAAVYAEVTVEVDVSIDVPEVGKPFPQTAVVRRHDGNGGWEPATVSLTWYKIVSDQWGDHKAAVAGTVESGERYLASFSCSRSSKDGLCFSPTIDSTDVHVQWNTSKKEKALDASVDKATGTLSVTAMAVSPIEGESTAAGTGAANVKMVSDGFKAAVLSDGTESNQPMLLSDDGAESQSDRISLGEFDVTYTKGDADVTIVAPAQANYNFCNWEGAKPDWVRNDVDGTITVPLGEVDEIGQLTAVYTPVVTEAKIGLTAPVAGGDDLASSVTGLMLTCSNGIQVDLVDPVGADSLSVTWSPAGEDGKAGYSMAHTAMIKVAENAEDLVDVDRVIATGAVVTDSRDGNPTEADAAGFALIDGDLYLCVTFPATAAVKAISVAQPADVELTFEQAKACSELGTWPLAGSVDVKLESGEAAEGDITWQAVEGFDASATAAQELTVKGTVSNISNADGDEIDDSGVSHEVACTVKVAAPSQDGGGNADGNSNVDGSNTADKGGKSALAKTGDSIPAFAVAGVAAVALIAAGAASIAALRRRRS